MNIGNVLIQKWGNFIGKLIYILFIKIHNIDKICKLYFIMNCFSAKTLPTKLSSGATPSFACVWPKNVNSDDSKTNFSLLVLIPESERVFKISCTFFLNSDLPPTQISSWCMVIPSLLWPKVVSITRWKIALAVLITYGTHVHLIKSMRVLTVVISLSFSDLSIF